MFWTVLSTRLSKAFDKFRKWTAFKTLLELVGVWKYVVLGAIALFGWVLPWFSHLDTGWRVLIVLGCAVLSMATALFVFAFRVAKGESTASGTGASDEDQGQVVKRHDGQVPGGPKKWDIAVVIGMLLLAVVGAMQNHATNKTPIPKPPAIPVGHQARPVPSPSERANVKESNAPFNRPSVPQQQKNSAGQGLVGKATLLEAEGQIDKAKVNKNTIIVTAKVGRSTRFSGATPFSGPATAMYSHHKETPDETCSSDHLDGCSAGRFSAMAIFAGPCESLTSLTIPNTIVTSAAALEAGGFTPPGPGARGDQKPLPAFCRVLVVSKPVDDSEIHFELWLPPARILEREIRRHRQRRLLQLHRLSRHGPGTDQWLRNGRFRHRSRRRRSEIRRRTSREDQRLGLPRGARHDRDF